MIVLTDTSKTAKIIKYDHILSVTDTTAVNAHFGHFDIFILMESSLYRASNDAINFVVF